MQVKTGLAMLYYMPAALLQSVKLSVSASQRFCECLLAQVCLYQSAQLFVGAISSYNYLHLHVNHRYYQILKLDCTHVLPSFSIPR